MTCSFDVRTPFAKVFWAKLITVLDVWEPGACIKKQFSKRHKLYKNLLPGKEPQNLTVKS